MALKGTKTINLTGLGNDIWDAKADLCGWYDPTEELSGGVSVYRHRTNKDLWLEYGAGGRKCWSIKKTADRGTTGVCAYIDVDPVCLPENITTHKHISFMVPGQVCTWNTAEPGQKWSTKEVGISTSGDCDIIAEFVMEKLRGEAEGMLEGYILKQIVLAVFTGGAGNAALQMYESTKAAMYIIDLTKLIAERQTADGKLEITKALLDELWGIVFN